jgi:hypothetical protein
MKGTCVKVFDIEAFGMEGGWYKIMIYWKGECIESIVKPTMKDAWMEYVNLGYKRFERA